MSDPIVEAKNIDKREVQKPIILFGKDVREIKCFRKSFIYGICFGVAGGLATFLFTSKTIFSTNMAFVSLWIGVLGYWVPCRYEYETTLLRIRQITEKKAKAKVLESETTSDKTS